MLKSIIRVLMNNDEFLESSMIRDYCYVSLSYFELIY
jgi:hypothetical protein